MTYSFVLADSFRSHAYPGSGLPSGPISFMIIAVKIARIPPDGSGSRITILLFHFGSRRSSHSRGASSALTASVLYAMTSGVWYVPYQKSFELRACASTASPHDGRNASRRPSFSAWLNIVDGAPHQMSA